MPGLAAVAQAEGGGDAKAEPKEKMIKPNFPDDTNLKVLADFVSQRLNLNFIYDSATLKSRKITLRASVAVPESSLLDLLSGSLQTNSLTLKKTAIPNTYRIQTVTNLINASQDVIGDKKKLDATKAGQAVAKVYAFTHTRAERVDQLLKSYITTPGGSSQVIAEHNLLIINDYVSNLKRLEELIKLADRPLKDVKFELVKVASVSAKEMSDRVSAVLLGKAKAQGLTATFSQVSLVPEPGSNALVVFAVPNELDTVVKLIKSLDTSLAMTTEVYRFKLASAERIDEVIISMLGEDKAQRVYRSVPDEGTNELVVTTTPEVHKLIKLQVEKMDKPRAAEESPIRFYKLKNANAEELLKTLKGIRGGDEAGGQSESGGTTPRDVPRVTVRDGNDQPGTGPTRGTTGASTARGGQSSASGGSVAELPDARIISDPATNTLIVVANPSIQPLYEKLIKQLDIRLPQVLVEATVVAIDTTDDFQLGVEFSRNEAVNSGRLLNFTQFGLSTVDETDGQLTITPGLGYNGALIDADLAEVIIKALQTDTRSTVVTSPQILVNDNATGLLSSEDEEPFETNVLSGGGTSQTSLGGFATAGTRIEVTPSISEGDYLKLEYDITLSSFSGTRASDSLPPARSTNQLTSVATIPDGQTIVVGGLTREIDSDTVNSIPFLGKIPIVRYAFSSTSKTKRKVTLFIFLRPVILRDDKFEDLKVLSGAAAGRANLPSTFPDSEPMEIR